MTKRPYRPTVKQILVRDFNWRMGNLRRILMCAHSLDSDLANQMQQLVREQMDREISKHENRLFLVEKGLGASMAKSRTIMNAIYESERARRR